MQAREVLHNLLMQTCGQMHVVRREALETMVWAGMASQRMTVTGLGRAIRSTAREKHNIKRADRLLSNRHLQLEREAIDGVLVDSFSPLEDPYFAALHTGYFYCPIPSGMPVRAKKAVCRLVSR